MTEQRRWQKLLLGDRSRESGKRYIIWSSALLLAGSLAVLIAGAWIIGLTVLLIAVAALAYANWWWGG